MWHAVENTKLKFFTAISEGQKSPGMKENYVFILT
jgi:hypothetical protein